MDLRVLVDGAETSLPGAGALHPRDLGRFGEGILFGAFELGVEQEHPLLARILARPNIAWWQSLRREELASVRQLGHATNERGVLLAVQSVPARIPCSASERFVVCTPTGIAYQDDASLAGLLRLAECIAFRQSTKSPNAFVKDDAPHVPLVYDARSTRGARGYINAILDGNEELGDALLPLVLETLDPVLALREALDAFVVAGRRSSAREMEKMGARYGARWTDYEAQRHASPAPDPVEELIAAGFGNATPGTLIWCPATQRVPTSVVKAALEGLSHWRALRPETAAWLHTRIGELSAEDVYVTLQSFDHRHAQDRLPRIAETPLCLVVLLLASYVPSARFIEKLRGPGVTELFDALLTFRGTPAPRRPDRDAPRQDDPCVRIFGWHLDTEYVMQRRQALAPFDEAFVDNVRTTLARFAEKPSQDFAFNPDFAVLLLSQRHPSAIESLPAKAVLALAPGCNPRLVDILKQHHNIAGLTAIAKSTKLDLGMRTRAAESAVTLGDASCTELAKTLGERFNTRALREL